MPPATRLLVSTVVALAAAVSVPAQVNAAPAVDGEFDIPGGVGTDNDIVQGPDGNMWVTTNDTNGVARITPAGVVTEFPLGNDLLRDRGRAGRQPLGLDRDRSDQGPSRLIPNNPTAFNAIDLDRRPRDRRRARRQDVGGGSR